MKLLAHLTMINDVRKEQTLQEHCVQTAKYAADSVKTAGFYNTAYLAGLLHDCGKGTDHFNAYLEKAFCGENVVRGSVNHTFAGVIYLLEKYHAVAESQNKWQCLTGEVISYAIGAHHGMFDCADLEGNNGFLHRLQKDKEEICYAEAVHNYFEQVTSEDIIDEYFKKAVQEVQGFFESVQNDGTKRDETFFQVGLLVRLILSAVIYGDRRDTSEFMSGRLHSQNLNVDWKLQRKQLEDNISNFDSTTPINQVRNDISEQCLKFAENPTGIYRLNVPTGAGKTLCTLRYALAHGEKFQKKRIIFIIPLLSILDQNAKVIKENIANPGLVLEHHSNVVCEEEKDEELDRYELMTESWNAPIVISTLVQLLNILFTHKTSAIGRMRALCDSVIVIDEIQSLPKKVTLMFNAAMNFLSKYCNTTVVLSSATQPCLEEVQWSIKLAAKPDMVRLSKMQQEVFKRAEILNRTNPYGMDLDECADFCSSLIEKQDSLLVICNTKSEARRLYEKIQALICEDEVHMYHLSTSMCQEHRMYHLTRLQKELEELQRRLRRQESGVKIICISTQLVEAGVDFSFECVVRVMAGIDNLAQAAGRCNRSNEYNRKGEVYLINLKKENLKNLPEIMSAQSSTHRVLASMDKASEEDLIGELSSRMFYQYLFEEEKRNLKYPVKEYGNTIYLSELLANQNQFAGEKSRSYILRQPFKTVGHMFQVFDDNTIDVVVPYKQGKELIEKLKELEKGRISFTDLEQVMREIKPYTINIFQWQKDKLYQEGLLEPCLEGRLFILSEKVYDDRYGLGEITEQAVETFII